MKRTKEMKGITLVALIITIIVLLILAVVAINAVQNDGIIEYAKNTRTEYEEAQRDEQSYLDYYTSQIQSSNGDVIVHNAIIPKGGTYYVGVTDTARIGDIQGITPTYKEGDKFPEPTQGDIYVYGQYEYRYKMAYSQNTNDWQNVPSYTWNPLVLDTTLSKYEPILTTINNIDIVSVYTTFLNCVNLKEAPVIPNTVTSMGHTFSGCTSLEKAPTIPDKVNNMVGTFYNCTALGGNILITTLQINDVTSCFYTVNNSTVPLTLEGVYTENKDAYVNESVLDSLIDTANKRTITKKEI